MVRNDPAIAVILTVHDEGTYFYHFGNLFGNSHILQFVNPSLDIRSDMFAVKRQRITELNR